MPTMANKATVITSFISMAASTDRRQATVRFHLIVSARGSTLCMPSIIDNEWAHNNLTINNDTRPNAIDQRHER